MAVEPGVFREHKQSRRHEDGSPMEIAIAAFHAASGLPTTTYHVESIRLAHTDASLVGASDLQLAHAQNSHWAGGEAAIKELLGIP